MTTPYCCKACAKAERTTARERADWHRMEAERYSRLTEIWAGIAIGAVLFTMLSLVLAVLV